ncbi:sugar ABC transporter ATP-binding protein [Cryobacterium sp. Hh11]|uniref:sugar ABC transporter ATP-binding protein n=1 Tax=Cryobacterium sp. Hh11 TaxID=2555868 RepID=UPI00106D78F9|nr:sugar ABC transporter ATP-binding protein [Cryobacterium sp. Hh11]TFD48734.1 sugar ABC transporter ATP-binding protein [Cryobacterium sp. Hh11]
MSHITITDVRKRFGGTLALDGVSLSIASGTVHGVLGENGAGKTTLNKVLAGVLVPDSGSFIIDGQVVPFGKPLVSRAAGLAMAYQEMSSPLNITVAEKLLLPRLPRGRLGFVSRRFINMRAGEILSDWGKPNINPRAEIGDLDLADKQYVEIIAALATDPKLLILDEPTASLPESDWLFSCIDRITKAGASVIYISHKLAEIRRICSTGTVLRNGRVVKEFQSADVDDHDLVEFMIGRSLELVFPEKVVRDESKVETIVKITDLTVGDLTDLSAEIKAGEIVGIAGLEGQGQKDLFYCLAGLKSPLSGEVEVFGSQNAKNKPNFTLVPEDRKVEGLFLPMLTQVNLVMAEPRKVSRWGLLSPKRERAVARTAARAFNIPVQFLSRNIQDLSGGNQQKVLFGRAVMTEPRCLLLFDPTRGVDAATKIELYHMARSFARNGGCVLIYSTEIPELVGLSDRVYTIYGGKISGEFSGDWLTESALMRGAIGHQEGLKE